MSHKEVKSEEQSELNITRRSVLGAGAVIAGINRKSDDMNTACFGTKFQSTYS